MKPRSSGYTAHMAQRRIGGAALPSLVSRSLEQDRLRRSGSSRTLLPTTPFAGHLIWGALDAAPKNEHLLLIAERGDPEFEKEMIDAIWDRGVDGIVLASMYTFRASMPKGCWPAPVCSSTLSQEAMCDRFSYSR